MNKEQIRTITYLIATILTIIISAIGGWSAGWTWKAVVIAVIWLSVGIISTVKGEQSGDSSGSD